jgi:hypothetical protein
MRNTAVAEALAEVAQLQDRVSDALESGATSDVERLMALLVAAERRRNRLVHSQLPKEDGPTYAAEPPLREQIIRTLALLTRPVSLGLISDVARARWGEYLPPARMASLRRDELRSYKSPVGQRPVYVVPALSSDRFAPARGVLALSSWSLPDRILAPASPRVDLLVVLNRLVDEMPAAKVAGAGEALSRVIWRLARTVPDAVGQNFDLQQVAAAARAELAALEGDDRAERDDAAERARDQLDDVAQLFGSPGLRGVDMTEARAREA